MHKPLHFENKNPSYGTAANPWYVAAFIAGIVLLVPSMVISLSHHLTGFEAQLFHSINDWPNFLRIPALLITEGLGAGYPIALCILIPLVMKRYRLAWRFLVVVGGAGVVMEVAKLIVREPRPVVMLSGHLHERAVETGLNSFPSGHQAVATAMAMIVWMLLPGAWKWLSIAWIVLVGVSRVYLGVHTPLDIVGGFAIGMMAMSFVQILPYSLARRLRLDNEKPLLAKGWEGVDLKVGSKQVVEDY